MGWISGGRIIEEQIISFYDKGILNPEILDTLVEPFKETDCDTAGFKNLKANDGKDVYQVICFVMMPEEYNKIVQKLEIDKNKQNEYFISSDEGYDLWKNIWEDKWNIF